MGTVPGTHQRDAGPLEREPVVYRNREQALGEELDQTAEPDRTDNRAGSRPSRRKIAVSSLRDNDLPRYKPELEFCAWCAAHPAAITGHSYSAFGLLSLWKKGRAA